MANGKGWMASKDKDLLQVSKFGWQYHDTKWSKDETLEFKY